MKLRYLIFCLGAGLMAVTPAAAQVTGGNNIHENGIGPDPDRDTNPATVTRAFKRTNDFDAEIDKPYRVINFEAPPGKHGDTLRDEYARKYGVHFGRGLKRQICEGQRRFYYDSMCTYEAAPSGEYAAGFLNYLNAPLLIEFDEPVCVVTMAIYPTGGVEGEPFNVMIRGWDEMDIPLAPATTEFEWTNKTVRWRHMAGAYYLHGRAKKIAVSMKSGKASEAGDVLRFLIDDLAFVQDDCDTVLDGFVEADADAQTAETAIEEDAADSLEGS